MIKIVPVIVLIVAVAAGVVGFTQLQKRGLPNLQVRLPQGGSVKGISTEGTGNQITDSISAAIAKVQSIGSVLGTTTTKTGAAVADAVSSTPSTQADVIDVSKVVGSVTSQLQQVPATLVKRAQVEYCKQVLQNATSSGAVVQ